MTDHLRNQITSFRQEDDEAMHETWERYRDLFRRYLMHGLPEWTQVSIFYNSVNTPTRMMLDASANGTLLDKPPRKSLEILDKLAQNDYQHPTARRGSARPIGGFPSDTEVAKGGTHEQCNAITTRSGKILKNNQEGTVVNTPPATDTPAEADAPAQASEDHSIPPHTLGENSAESLNAQSDKPQVHINLPLVEAVQQMPNYAKFLKDMVTRKKRIEEFETAAATETCLALMHNKVPAKKTDPGSITIECLIGHNYPTKALWDLGASINLMPNSVFQKLGIGEAKPTTVMLQLADHSYVQPEGKIEDILVKVDKFIFPADFLILDCYNHIAIAPEHQSKTTFTCPYGTFAFRRMPFGLCNAPSTFQRCMTAIFSDLNEDCLEIFMDDFSTFGDNFDNCLSNLEKVLKRCKETNLVLNWEKCHFMVDEGIVLGHKISSKGMEVDKAKIEVISKLPPLTTVKGIRSFLGHASFY
ncbi:hypothetical protein GQ457_04G018980 [Hibiscus cannabinus]